MKPLARSPFALRPPPSRILLWLMTLMAAAGVTSCLASPVPQDSIRMAPAAPAGFFEGATQGALMMWYAARRISGGDAAVFDVHNTGWWYSAGFLFGSMAFGGLFNAFMRMGIDGIFVRDITRDLHKSVAGAVACLGYIGLSFLIADWGRTSPTVATFASSVQPDSCGVAIGFWHRISGLVSLAGSAVFDDVTIYQAGCGTSYDIGYALPQSLFILASLVIFGLGWRGSR